MSDNEEKLQKLLQLKNYESPGQEYFDDFLTDFKRNQRLQAAQLSKADLVKEKVAIWLDDLGPSKWAVPAGSMAALALAMFVWGNREQPIVETAPPVNKADPSQSETQVIELQLPKLKSGAPSSTEPSSKPQGVMPVNR